MLSRKVELPILYHPIDFFGTGRFGRRDDPINSAELTIFLFNIQVKYDSNKTIDIRNEQIS